MHRRIVSIVLAATFITTVSFAQTNVPTKSLYDRLGGQPAVQAVASGLVDKILADTRVNKWFAHAASSPENTKLYKEKLTAFICQSTGGPCKYTGMDMETAHKGRGVTSEAFNAVAEDLSGLLDQLKVPAKEKGEVMTLIGSLKPSIVQSTAKK
jgi:hemoglobin